jgi:single-stranded-DNA-specific exonuclease
MSRPITTSPANPPSSLPITEDAATVDRATLLGVERSLTGRRWYKRGAESERLALALAQRLDVPDAVARLLAARGVDLDHAEGFLAPTLRAHLPDPDHLLGMAEAVSRIEHAMRSGETIAVFGDYDVDGATSSALLQRFFGAAGASVRIYIPDRMAEGYGPNAPALLRLKGEGVGLVITVDCGVTAHGPLAAAAAAGLDVIVVDHHVAEPALPPAVAIVNPNRLDETSPHRQMAAVGVAFLLAVAVNRRLRETGWFDARGIVPPDLLQWLDLVALGTVCDVVPLTGVNRALVAQGLKVMARRGNAGIAALADVAGLDSEPGTYHVGFILGPRVNAGGRVGRADYGARLLATDDPDEAQRLARELHRYNDERKAIEAAVLDQATAAVEAEGGRDTPLVFAAGAGWHAGVIGIVASRLRERYNRPACVVALDGGIGRGSGRSVAGVALGPAVIAARQAGLLVNGGGHAMAAGFTVEAGRLGALRDFLALRIADQLAGAPLVPMLGLDGIVAPAAATADLIDSLARVGPFGVGNAEPRFAVPAVRVAKADVVGSDHVRCFISGGDGSRLKAIAFRALDGPLGRALLQSGGLALHIAGHLRADDWQGRRGVQLLIDDAAIAT